LDEGFNIGTYAVQYSAQACQAVEEHTSSQRSDWRGPVIIENHRRHAMARAPFQILVLPFRVVGVKVFEYALFKRSDEAYWQGLAGGGEDTETPLAAARREAFEEAQIPPATRFFALQTTTMIPVFHFKAREFWPKDLYVIPNFCYAADCSGLKLTLSSEHTDYKWMRCDEGYQLLRWDNNKTALWELHERLQNNDLPASV
jgi:dihydroneopterin triphosphate diphosphatase